MTRLVNPKLPEKLAEYREALDLNLPGLLAKAIELIDIMETELVCEGLLNADS